MYDINESQLALCMFKLWWEFFFSTLSAPKNWLPFTCIFSVYVIKKITSDSTDIHCMSHETTV